MSTSIPGLYRSLLRQFKLYPTLSNRNSRLRSDLRNKFRNKENVLNPAENQLERIELYHNLLKSVQQGTDLREQNSGERFSQSERIIRSAKRVGLELPEQYVENSDK